MKNGSLLSQAKDAKTQGAAVFSYSTVIVKRYAFSSKENSFIPLSGSGQRAV